MENQDLPKMVKKVMGVARVIYFMLRKGIISKRKLFMDLNLILKRGNKIATKAIAMGNLMFHLHHSNHRDNHHLSFPPPPAEYEFSCSNTPTYTLPFHLTSKRRHHHGHHHTNFFGCAFHAPPTQDDNNNDLVTMNAVKLALEMLNNNNHEMVVPAAEAATVVAASPLLPGFGRSPMVRQLRITDSPFPLRGVDDDNGFVDKKAEEYIQWFYKELKKQQRSMN